MTTLAELVVEDPSPTHGRPIQASYGSGQWRLAFQIADPYAGDAVEWHDLTARVESVQWSRGSRENRGRYRISTPVVLLTASDDSLAPWNDDTSATFGTHVQLGRGTLMRLVVFRVASSATDLSIPLFTVRCRRWGDAQAGRGQHRMHRVEGVDLVQELHARKLSGRRSEGWKARLDACLTGAGWQFGYDVYAAELADGETTLQLPRREQVDSATAEIDATLAPTGLVWRQRPNGTIVVHPTPWDDYHQDYFDSAATITGTEWSNPLLDYAEYPSGVVFDWDPTGNEVGFATEHDGSSFGIESDLENVANAQIITHPVDVRDPDQGSIVSAFDNPVSLSIFGMRPLPADTWLAENDIVLTNNVNARAFSELVASPLRTGIDYAGAFPAIALLDHLDPVTVNHASASGRDEISVAGPLRTITHKITQRRQDTSINWETLVQFDVDSPPLGAALEAPTGVTLDTVSQNYAEFSWTDPGGHAATPTNTQVRVFGLFTEWTPIGYPATTTEFEELLPGTWYDFEVRFVRRAGGVLTHQSPSTRLKFKTPAAERASVARSRSVIPDDDLDADPDCSTDWKLELSYTGAEPWFLVDSGDDTDFGTDGSDTVLDLSSQSFQDGVHYRLATRKTCDGEPGEWHYSTPYVPAGSRLETMLVELVAADEAVATGTDVVGGIPIPWPCELLDVWAHATSDTGTGATTIDANVNGSTALSTKSTIASGQQVGSPAVVSTVRLAADDVLTFDIDAAASSLTGPLYAVVLLEREID